MRKNETVQVVTLKDGKWSSVKVKMLDAVLEIEKLGYKHVGEHTSEHTRSELQHCPVFAGLLGPMFDGERIRYENQDAYNRLSA